MGMNSFSFQQALHDQQSQQQWEKEISGILDLGLGTSDVPEKYEEKVQKLNFQPVNLDDLKKTFNGRQLGRRVAPRYDVELTVLVCNHKKIFRTQSQNLSFSGALLKDFLPDEFINHRIDIIMIQILKNGKKKYLLFRGRALEGALRSNRIFFDSLTRDSERKLGQLFHALLAAA